VKENRKASDVAILSLGGRVLTFVGRTLYVGHFGSAHPLLNAFAHALQVPQVLFNIAGTALTTVMIPVYNTLLAEEKRDEAKAFIDNVITISLLFLFFVVAAGLAAAPLISRVVGGADFGEGAYLTFALRFLMPTMIFFGFGAIFTGLLQSHGRFRLPALVSVPGGIILIGYMIFFGDRFGVTGLLFATLLGVISQPLILLPAVRRLGYRYAFSLDFKNKSIRAAGKLCVPVLISVVSYQAHFIFAHAMALRMGLAAIVDYAQQLVLVFIFIIVLAVAAVYFPKLSALWAVKKVGEYNENLKNALLYTIFLVLPAACGLFLLRFDIVELLLNRRGLVDVRLAGNLIGLYAVGVVGTSLKEIADRGFYAMQDAKTPAVFGLAMMAVNITVTVLLIPHVGVYAMPMAYGVAAVCGVGGLLVCLQYKTRFITRRFLGEVGKIAAAAAVMAAVVWGLTRAMDVENRMLMVAVSVLAGAAVYFALAYALRVSVMGKNGRGTHDR